MIQYRIFFVQRILFCIDILIQEISKHYHKLQRLNNKHPNNFHLIDKVSIACISLFSETTISNVSSVFDIQTSLSNKINITLCNLVENFTCVP